MGDRGTSLSSNPSIIALQIYRYDKKIIGVLLHEFAHSLLKVSMPPNLTELKSAFFEDALLDYFAPYGILDMKIGLIKSLDIEVHQKEQETLRPYSSGTSRMLLPIMKEYYPVCGEKTIWRFLKGRKVV